MKAVGIILAGGNSSRLQSLSSKRAVAAMPLGGTYRSIDFALSNTKEDKQKKDKQKDKHQVELKKLMDIYKAYL